MSALISDHSFLPWISFVAGIGGSLHCVGMCGGLVTATCQKTNDVIRYQLGRLLGYLCLGFFAGLLGKIFSIQESNPKITVIFGLILGSLFLFWGIQNFRGKKAEIPLPIFLSQLYTKLWMSLVFKNKSIRKSFFTGMISLFLPCGLLYGIVIGVATLEHSLSALTTMFFFWLGTLPSMIMAPSLIQKILKPLKSKLPKTYAISLIIIGLITISTRVIKFQAVNSEHNLSSNIHHCH